MRLPADLSHPSRLWDPPDREGPSPQRDRLDPRDLALWMPGRWDQLDREPWKQLPPGPSLQLRQWDPLDRWDRAPWKQRLLDRSDQSDQQPSMQLLRAPSHPPCQQDPPGPWDRAR